MHAQSLPHTTSRGTEPSHAPTRLLKRPPPGENRNLDQLFEQYVVEKELATRLKTATASERGGLYTAVYEELYRRVPHHPQLRNKVSPDEQAKRIARQLSTLDPWLKPETVFLEIGAGDCALSFAVAKRVAKVYGLDVSPAVTHNATQPENFELVMSDGTSVPVAPGSITLAFSNQLMEHLHPDDALQQLQNIYDALAPGGAYICFTPNGLSGPHDISRYFEPVASGFHLKEYTCGEAISLFKRVGFKSVRQCFRTQTSLVPGSTLLTRIAESSLQMAPRSVRALATRNKSVRGLLELRLIAQK
jgi:SAM-dependent methyltransferase